MSDLHTPVVGRVAVVTGAASGLGHVIADHLARAGAHVLAVDRDAVDEGGPLTPYVADLSVDDELDGIVEAARRMGGPHVLISNAGGWTPGNAQFPEVDPDSWSRTLDLDLRAPMRLTQRFLRADAGADRVVVLVSSSAALGPSPYSSPEYAVAKAGLIRLTTALRGSEATHGVRVLCLVPGWIGLPRALRQVERLSDRERAETPALIPPDLLGSLVLRMVEDPTLRSGTVVHVPHGEEVTIERP